MLILRFGVRSSLAWRVTALHGTVLISCWVFCGKPVVVSNLQPEIDFRHGRDWKTLQTIDKGCGCEDENAGATESDGV